MLRPVTSITKLALNMTPLPHQEQVADKLDDQYGQVVQHGLGSGKTMTAINAADRHKLPLLAIVPAGLRNNMRKEIANSGFKGEARVMSYQEALKSMHDPEFLEFASKSLVAYDEAHRMGQTESERSALAKGVPATRKLFLTATPVRNHPSELAPLINAISPGALPDDPKEFRKTYIHSEETPVGFFGKMVGAKPGRVETPKNLDQFRRAVAGKVDFYEAADRSAYPSFHESTVDVPMSDKQQAAYNFVMGKYPVLAYKIRHGLPQSKNEEADFTAFMSGPRQVVNHPGAYHASATDEDAPKIQLAADEIEKRSKTDKNYRGVAYSAFVDSGIDPLSRELERRGISHARFTGEQNDKVRKQTIENYNSGKVPVLLISGAGAEGLDLKGTKHMAILEPHWNEKLIDQVRGRGIRYKSHAHLPEAERHVEVQRFHSVGQPSWFDRLRGKTRSSHKSADEYVNDRAQEKHRLNDPFLAALKNEEPVGAKVAGVESEFVSWLPPRYGATAGILFDLDETLIGTPGKPGPTQTGEQFVLPRRLEILRLLSARGYTLVGVTNRTARTHTPLATVLACLQEANCLLEGLLVDIYFSSYPDPAVQKPAPTMLAMAMRRHTMTPDLTIMVGDSDADRGAAAAAGVSFVYVTDFFAASFEDVPSVSPGLLPSPTPRWTVDPLGRLVGVLECNGQDAVNALRAAIEAEAERRDVPVPATQSSETVLRVTVPANAEFAAWIDEEYDRG